MESLVNFRKSILEDLKHKREKLSENSLRTYTSCLFSLYNKMDGNGGLEFYSKHKKEIMVHLKDIESNKRKTLLSALFIITGIPEYKELMIKDCSAVNQIYKEQKMSRVEKLNWITMQDIREKYEEYLNEVIKMFSHKAILNDKTIIDFLILGLMSGVSGIPPRRSLDYSLMKIRNFDKTKDNYYEKDKMTFNIYKTEKFYGPITINLKQMAPQINMLIKKWITINKNDYLLYSANDKLLSSSQLSQHNNAIWGGKKVSTDIYRHTYLTDIFKNERPSYIQMQDLAKLMGHSLSMQQLYIKTDAPE